MASEPASVCRPPGLLYLCMKHITDRYNMYYSYAPTKLNEQIHMAAIHQAIFAPLLGLVWMLFFSVLRLGTCRAPLASRPSRLLFPHRSIAPHQRFLLKQTKPREEQGVPCGARPRSAPSVGPAGSC